MPHNNKSKYQWFCNSAWLFIDNHNPQISIFMAYCINKQNKKRPDFHQNQAVINAIILFFTYLRIKEETNLLLNKFVSFWRRRRDLNSRAGLNPTYTLSRGASSANLSTSPNFIFQYNKSVPRCKNINVRRKYIITKLIFCQADS